MWQWNSASKKLFSMPYISFLPIAMKIIQICSETMSTYRIYLISAFATRGAGMKTALMHDKSPIINFRLRFNRLLIFVEVSSPFNELAVAVIWKGFASVLTLDKVKSADTVAASTAAMWIKKREIVRFVHSMKCSVIMSLLKWISNEVQIELIDLICNSQSLSSSSALSFYSNICREKFT